VQCTFTPRINPSSPRSNAKARVEQVSSKKKCASVDSHTKPSSD
jgi:hypothetical protein